MIKGYGWGSNGLGQLGDGTNTQHSIPTKMVSGKDFVQIDGGFAHAIVLASDGTMWTWGYNFSGQLGDGTNTDSNVALQIGIGFTWSYISANNNFSVAIRSDGTIWAWGGGGFGQLGDSSHVDKNIPTQVGSDTNWKFVSCGTEHVLAIKTNGELWGWGLNANNQINSSFTTFILPSQIGTDTDWRSAYGARASSHAIKTDNTMWAWGWNNFGQLGDGTNIQRANPVQIGINEWDVASPSKESLFIAIKTDGTIWGTGQNSWGGIGDGTNVDKNSFVQAGIATDWKSVTCGSAFTLAMKTDGTLWAWGDNFVGEVGDGTTIDRFSPVQVSTALKAQAIGTCNNSSLAALIFHQEKVYSIGVKNKQYCFPSASGIGIPLPGYFAGMNATFGFNSTPHNFSIDIVKETSNINDVSLSDLPDLRTNAKIYVGSKYFLAAGRVSHASYSRSSGGLSIKIDLNDRRTDLDLVSVFTDDIGENSSIKSGNMVSVGNYIRKNRPHLVNRREFETLISDGANYQQLYETIINTNSEIWDSVGLSASGFMPSPATIGANLWGAASGLNLSLDSYHWKFAGESVKEVLTRVCTDLGFDWYWHLEDRKVALINRTIDVSVNEQVLLDNFTDEQTISLDFGKTATENPMGVGLLGARQEGFVDSPLLSDIDGLLTPSGVVFEKAWDKMSVSFIDSMGIRRTYKPNNVEFSAALKGIEEWLFYKKYQRGLWGFPHDAGSKAASDPDVQSRIDDNIIDEGLMQYLFETSSDNVDPRFPDFIDVGVHNGTPFDFRSLSASKNLELQELLNLGYWDIPRFITNRRDENQNWILEWYNRISSQAKEHFGRTYVASGLYLKNLNGYYDVVDKAWCNIENQLDLSQSGFYGDYKIEDKFFPLAPFLNDDYKISAHAILPPNISFGKEGDSAPGSFTSWSEDPATGFQYVPVKIFQVNNVVEDSQSLDNPFKEFENGSIIVKFPTIVGELGYHDPHFAQNKFVLGANRINLINSSDVTNSDYLIHPVEYFDNTIPTGSGIYTKSQINTIKSKITNITNVSTSNIGALAPLSSKINFTMSASGIVSSNIKSISKAGPATKAAASGLSISLSNKFGGLLPSNPLSLRKTNIWTGRISIPVRSTKRYGAGYPSMWASGLNNPPLYSFKTTQDERWAPWKYHPYGRLNTDIYEGPGTSVQQMNVRANLWLRAKQSEALDVITAQLVQTGLPTRTFDDYAKQTFSAVGNKILFGAPTVPMSSISTTFGMGGMQTSYNFNSYYSEFGIDAPIGRKTRGLLNKIIHPIDWTFIPASDSGGKSKNKKGGKSEGVGSQKPPKGKLRKAELDVSLFSGEKFGKNRNNIVLFSFDPDVSFKAFLKDFNNLVVIKNVGGEPIKVHFKIEDAWTSTAARLKITKVKKGAGGNLVKDYDLASASSTVTAANTIQTSVDGDTSSISIKKDESIFLDLSYNILSAVIGTPASPAVVIGSPDPPEGSGHKFNFIKMKIWGTSGGQGKINFKVRGINPTWLEFRGKRCR